MISERTQQKLLSGNEGERQLAAKKLSAKMSKEARELLVQQLRVEKHSAVLEWLCIGVRYCMAFEAAEPLVQLLHNSMGDVRRFACEALEKVGSEKCVARLETTASSDSDYHVRLAAIKALAGIGIRLLEFADEIMTALDRAHKANKGDLAQAALVARNDVKKALEKSNGLTLFPSSLNEPLEATNASKTKDLDQLTKYLRAHNLEPEEIRYTVSVVRSIVRNKSVVQFQKRRGIENCQLCERPFFIQRNGKPYCQMAHIKALKDRGLDSTENTLLLCPNCHAEMDLAQDAEIEGEEIISITLPNCAAVRFQIEKGKAPKRID